MRTDFPFFEISIRFYHAHTLYEVETDLPFEISELVENGYQNFQIIHGFRSGQVLKNYGRNQLIKKLRRDLDSISAIRTTSECGGDTFTIIDF